MKTPRSEMQTKYPFPQFLLCRDQANAFISLQVKLQSCRPSPGAQGVGVHSDSVDCDVVHLICRVVCCLRLRSTGGIIGIIFNRLFFVSKNQGYG